jgi:hypothetical protein
MTAVHASAFWRDTSMDSPITRKQASLYQAAKTMGSKRFSRLHELLEWQVWMYHSARTVTRSIYPDVRHQEYVARKIAEYLAEQCKCKQWPADADAASSMGRMLNNVIKVSLGMILDPIWQATPDRYQKDMRELLAFLRRYPEGWAITMDCTPQLRNMRAKVVTRVIKKRVKDKFFVDSVHKLIRGGAMQFLGLPGCSIRNDVAFALLMCDIVLGQLDLWFCRIEAHIGSEKEASFLKRTTPQVYYYRKGSHILCFLRGGTHTEAHAVGREAVEALRTQCGLEDVEYKAFDVSKELPFSGLRLSRVRRDTDYSTDVAVPQDAVESYKCSVRTLTVSARIADYGPDVLIFSLNALIRDWALTFCQCEVKGLFRHLDAWTETRVLRFLSRKHGGVSREAIARRFCGSTSQSVLIEQRVPVYRSVGTEVAGTGRQLFLDRLSRYNRSSEGLFIDWTGSVGSYMPACAVCSTTSKLGLFPSCSSYAIRSYQDFAILCSKCKKDLSAHTAVGYIETLESRMR